MVVISVLIISSQHYLTDLSFLISWIFICQKDGCLDINYFFSQPHLPDFIIFNFTDLYMPKLDPNFEQMRELRGKFPT